MFHHDQHDPGQRLHERVVRHALRNRRRETHGGFGRDFGHGFGPGPGFGPGRGFGAGFGVGFGPGRHGWWRGAFFGPGPRVRRGDVRSAILALLAEQPMHGYQIINELEARSGGRWRPSAGSVYPTLQQLEDEGLVRAEERDGRRVFTLTEEGRAAAADPTRGGTAPWETDADDEHASLRGLLFQVAAATMQVSQVGSPELTVEARRVLTEARRSLYRLLAEDEAPSAETTGSTDPTGSADATDRSSGSTDPIG